MGTAAIGEVAAQRLATIEPVAVDPAQLHHRRGFGDDHFGARCGQRQIDPDHGSKTPSLRPGGNRHGIAFKGSGGAFHCRHLAARSLEAGDRRMLHDPTAQILDRPGIGLHRAVRVGMAAEPVMDPAEAIAARQRHRLNRRS